MPHRRTQRARRELLSQIEGQNEPLNESDRLRGAPIGQDKDVGTHMESVAHLPLHLPNTSDFPAWYDDGTRHLHLAEWCGSAQLYVYDPATHGATRRGNWDSPLLGSN
jgi:hypothetical protein